MKFLIKKEFQVFYKQTLIKMFIGNENKSVRGENSAYTL